MKDYEDDTAMFLGTVLYLVLSLGALLLGFGLTM